MSGAVWRTEQGEGPVVVLVHGSMDRSTSFARMTRHLGDFVVVRYDRRGYGRSVDLGPAVGIEQQADDLLDVIDGRTARVFGHSLGGVVALAAAAREPERFERVVAYEAPRSWLPWWPSTSAGGAAMADQSDPADVAERFMRRIVGDAIWERLPPSTRVARRSEGPALVAELRSVRPPNPPPYVDGDLCCAVTGAHGTESDERHHRAAVDLVEGVAGADLRVVEGAGHGVHVSHPAAAAALLAG